MNLLVVARWQENVDWATDLPPGWAVRVVQKDVDLPNRGREPATFAWAVLDMYEQIKPGDVYGFVQGNPFDHCPDLLARLAEPVGWFTPLGQATYTSDAHGRPHHPGVPVAACHERWLGAPFPGEVTFAAGGQFAVTGKALRSRPVGFYRAMFDDLMADDGLGPWAAERLWPVVYTRE